ncbi:MAG: ABC transporter permease [Proteobacteria bacterium]|nr:ABC transporter permease [Pseudomonadota bacterium]
MIRWIFRELRNNKRFSAFFILNLALGLTGFLCLDAFKSSMDAALQANSKNFLSADLAVESRRDIRDDEIKAIRGKLPQGAQEGRLVEFFSMVASKGGSRLVQVKAIDQTYPFYGELILGSGEKIQSTSSKEALQQGRAWVYPELLSQLKLQVGDEISIGQLKIPIADVIQEDSSQTFRLSSLAPKIYLDLGVAQRSQLIQFGSTKSDVYLLKLPAETSVGALMAQMKTVVPDPMVRFEDPEEAGEDSARALQYLSDYLGLVSLVALFLASLGTAYLYRSFVSQRFKSIAILNSLGLQRSQAQWVYIGQLSALGLVAAVVSLIAAYFLLPFLAQILRTLSPIDIPLQLSLKTSFLALLMGALGSLIVCYPFLFPIRRIKLSQLFQEESQIKLGFRWTDAALFLPSLVFYYVLSVWQANSIKVGSVFVGLFFASLAVLLLIGWLLIQALKYFPKDLLWYVKQSLLQLQRRPVASVSAVVALGLGSLLINLMPQLKESLKADLESPRNLKLPSLFMFDIQDDQIDPLVSFLNERNIRMEFKSPMVRGRILAVNGESYERVEDASQIQSREEEAEVRFRNRGVNLSYRDQLSSSEEIVEGKFYEGVWDGNTENPFELSVEKRYAERLNLKLNDILLFDVQGVEMTGKITSFRTVKWNSFQPNFFILVQSGVLEQAPKTFLGAIPQMQPNEVAQIQDALVASFPNVSMVDVARSVKRIFELGEKMTWSLEIMAALSLLAGFVVLFSMAQHQVQMRRWDLNMLKILGAKAGDVQKSLLIEFGVLGLIASFFGVTLSLALSLILNLIVFDGTFLMNWKWPVITLISVTLLSMCLSWIASFRWVNEKASVILRGDRA